MILDLIYDIYFGISYGNSRIYFLLFRSYYDIFGSDFYDILFLHLCEILPYVCLVSAPAVLSI